ncbi:MAG: hypothetical protein WC028_29660 [Candidatus Obscuribacterales bacterium]
MDSSSRDDAGSVAAGVVHERHGLAVEIRDGDQSAEIVVCESHGVFLALFKERVVWVCLIGRLAVTLELSSRSYLEEGILVLAKSDLTQLRNS